MVDLPETAPQSRGRRPTGELRQGWTTGACATAAARAAYEALLTGEFPDPVVIRLPRGQRATFVLAERNLENSAATAGVIKDAGDDPDVTHGARIFIDLSLRDAPGVGPGAQELEVHRARPQVLHDSRVVMFNQSNLTGPYSESQVVVV